MKTSIVWFKKDLRLHDNETLVRAIAESDEVIPVYCFDDSQFATSEFGFKKTGAFRAQFLLQSLSDLDKNLRPLGSGLVIAKGNPAHELLLLVKKYSATAIYTAAEVAHEELQTLKEVQEYIKESNCTLKVFSTNTLYHTSDLPFPVHDLPDVFTAFRHKVESQSMVRAIFSRPGYITSPPLPAMTLPALSDLNLSAVVADGRAAINFCGGEDSAIQRLNYYIGESRLVATYKETRNQLVGPDYSTKFSAWLACGCLSARYIYDQLKEYEYKHGANESTYWVFFELLWRDYFQFMMAKYGRKFFFRNGIKGGAAKPVDRPVYAAMQQWIAGATGVDFVDANMLELKLTGFMSNRGRQNVASYFCHDLKLDWRYGAAYFEEQLIDYDVCSNWCNWAYIAGVGNDPRSNRYFNITKQAEQYDADKRYRTLWMAP